MVRGLGVERKQKRPDEPFVRSTATLHFSLTPGFNRVLEHAHAGSRLNGFRPYNPAITGVNSGVNEKFAQALSFVSLP